MLGMVSYLLVWMLVILRGKLNYWVGVLSVRLFFVVRLFIGPIYVDYQNWGYELGFDCLSYVLWVLRV
jgi:membrane protein YdbS with pleckstrin-like domain